MAQQKVVMTPLSKIIPPGEAQRNSIDPLKIIELAESIREVGLQEPILLRPMNGKLEIVFGHRRYLAHVHLKKDTIQSFIREMDDVEVIMIRAIENLQRENLSPMEEAKAYYLMKTKGGCSNKEIVRRTGKAEMTVKRYLRLYNMPEVIQRGVDSGRLSLNAAEKLIEIDDPQMLGYFAQMAVENGITEKVAELWVSDWRNSRAGKYAEGVGSGGDTNIIPESKPSFVACDCCSGAVDIRNARSMVVCVDCLNVLRGSRVVKVS